MRFDWSFIVAEFIESNASIFDLEVDAIINPVNCKGVSGAGLAKEFARRYPTEQRQYEELCGRNVYSPDATGTVRKASAFSPGDVFAVTGIDVTKLEAEIIDEGSLERLLKQRRKVIYFPTKNHWKRPSTYEYIEKGLKSLRKLELTSVAIPALGCGLGGLNPEVVSRQVFEALQDTDWTVYLLNPLRLPA